VESPVTPSPAATTGSAPAAERRASNRSDRRRRSRSGRRADDPHVNWRRIAWLFAAYAAYLSLRALPETVRRWFRRTPSAG
jgi:hypothetical protein